jgi:MFS transporter, DHA1 family, solute carrier family 18 (vesicular amine transporter), member 1/2
MPRRARPRATLLTVTVALFTDGFLYGVMVPLGSAAGVGADSEAMLGIMYGAYAVGVLATTPVFGILSDRVGRRPPMLWGFGVQAVATLLFAAAGGVGSMLVARLLQGVAAAATWTAGLALVAEHFTEHRAEKLGVAMMGSTGGLLVGPVTGGILLEWGGYQLPLLVAGGLLLLDGALRVTILADAARGEAPPSPLGQLVRDRSVLAAAVVVILSSIGWSLLEPLFPAHLARVAGASPATVGLLFTISSLMYGLTAPVVGKVVDRWGAWPTMTFGVVAMAVTLPLLVVPAAIVGAGVVLVAVDVAFGFLMNPTLDELASAVDRRHHGAYATVYAIFNMAYSVGTIGTTVVASALASVLSFRASLWGVSLALVASLPLLVWLRRGPSAAVVVQPAGGTPD